MEDSIRGLEKEKLKYQYEDELLEMIRDKQNIA
jgi:hypothetical protein